MKKCKVTFLPSNKEIEVSKGTVLLKAAQEAGVFINSPCSGQGTCGKCRVIVEKGTCSCGASTFLTKEEIDLGYCLACLSLVEGDIVVRIPVESRMEKSQIVTGPAAENLDKEIRIGDWELKPRTKKIFLKLSPPDLADNCSDLERLYRGLRGIGYNTNNTHCGLPLIRKLGKVLRDENWRVTVTLLEIGSVLEIMDVDAGDITRHRFGIAIDVGTTTIVVYLIDLIDGHILDVASDYNAQMSYGEDIISRIMYSTKGDGLKKLNELVILTINNLIKKLVKKANIKKENIDSLSCAGNTTMIHLLLGVDPRYIRQEPYVPTATFFPLIRAYDLGLKVNPYAYLYCVPGVAGYVGGDITAGVLASGIYKKKELSVFIDVGTNGEIVLGNSDWLMAASCSAGPAFEGGEVKCGMRASMGAIEGVIINRESYEPAYKTIGQVKARGICGSGIIDVLAEMFLAGIVDRRGNIRKEIGSERIRKREDSLEYVIAWGKETEEGRDIVFTEIDINNILRAKGAMYAGLSLMLKEMQLKVDDIDRFLVAGGFGSYLNIGNAIVIGLLPDIACDKFKYLGNSAVVGAQLALLSHELRKDAEQIARNTTYMELSVSKSFMDEYVSALFLPHTNIDNFPTVKDVLENKQKGIEC